MILTNENYYSIEANKKYLSVSQYKDFIGTDGSLKCEAKALAKINGTWTEEPTTAMLIGSFVDAHYEGTIEAFKNKNPELFTLKGELKAPFKQAEEIIKTGESDEMFSTYMSGEKQVIMTADLFDTPWKIKLDVVHKGKCLVDLKVIKSIYDKVWSNGAYMNFIQSYGYITQGAVYQRIYKINTGEELPFFLACLTKETPTDKAIIQIPDIEMELELSHIKMNIDHIIKLKNREEPPVRCEKCGYCRSTKILSEVTSFYDL